MQLKQSEEDDKQCICKLLGLNCQTLIQQLLLRHTARVVYTADSSRHVIVGTEASLASTAVKTVTSIFFHIMLQGPHEQNRKSDNKSTKRIKKYSKQTKCSVSEIQWKTEENVPDRDITDTQVFIICPYFKSVSDLCTPVHNMCIVTFFGSILNVLGLLGK